MKHIGVADLFSGAGGLSLGFDSPTKINHLGTIDYPISKHAPPFKTIIAVEKNDEARATFENNFPEAETKADITEVESFTQWKDEIQVVIGGPPCQGFSTLNQTKTEDLDDDRNQLWKEYLRAVEQLEPEIFLIENVPRFFNTDQFEQAKEHAKSLGYTITAQKTPMEKYGVPQARTRGFIIGSKHKKIPELTPTEEPVRTVRDAIGDLPFEPTGENLHEGRNVHQITKDRMEHIPYGGDRRDLPRELLPECWKDEDGFTDSFGRNKWEDPSSTIRGGFYDPMQGRFVHPEANRAYTLREGARIQTFPDDFEFDSDARTIIAKQLGNAVPPKMSYELAKHIHKHLTFNQ